MTRYMLDTNVVSAVMRGSTVLDAKLAELDRNAWCISAITHAEICYGLALRPEATKLARAARLFLAATTTIPWDQAAAEEHGRLRATLRLVGTPIGDFDEMIAAHALALGAVLVTDNERHFVRVPGLTVVNWIRDATGQAR